MYTNRKQVNNLYTSNSVLRHTTERGIQMRNHMQKKVPFTKIYLARIDPNLEVVKIEPLEVMGKLTDAQARRKVDNKYGNVTITEIEHFYHTYEMKVRDFIKYAYIKEGEINHG